MSSIPDAIQPGPSRPHRVVVLTGGGVLHRQTCATLIAGGAHVVGIVTCRRDGWRARGRQLLRWAARHGALRTADQVLARLCNRVLEGREDARALARLVDDRRNRSIIASSEATPLETDSYSRADTRAAIAGLRPDVLVVHSPFIVGASVRALATVAVLGGHPGLTPFYRGSYSAFWALAQGQPQMVGWTVFVLDDGIDTGPIVAQAPLATPPDESHMVLSWRGMMAEAEAQLAAIRRLDAGEPVPLRPTGPVPADSYFGPPTLRALWRYRRARRRAHTGVAGRRHTHSGNDS